LVDVVERGGGGVDGNTGGGGTGVDLWKGEGGSANLREEKKGKTNLLSNPENNCDRPHSIREAQRRLTRRKLGKERSGTALACIAVLFVPTTRVSRIEVEWGGEGEGAGESEEGEEGAVEHGRKV
jgi:hypothetical protein